MIFNSHKSTQFLQYTLEHDQQMMTNWFSANKLSLNIGKTVPMKFWNKDSKNHKFKLELDETELPLVALTKFLGVHIDQNLSWESHANYLVEKLNTNK